ncbi:MAG TPA: polyprenol monophosphomannose synthase [Polyangiaceae bacterium]|nr:polyprenol monophosphomannose synthase [Polyangiaceae bacterium]
MRPLIVVPTFNEVDNLQSLVHAVLSTLPSANILVVDDASADGTAAVARRLAATDSRLFLLERPHKAGLGSAYVAGLTWGLARDYDCFFEMDADFSHDPRYLPAFIAELERGAQVVVGSRNVPGGGVVGWGPLRHLLSRGGSLYSRLLLRAPVRDMTTGFKAYKRDALTQIDIGAVRSNGYAFQVETTHRALAAGLRVVELPIVFVDRRAGASKMSARDVWEAVWSVWRMRRG